MKRFLAIVAVATVMLSAGAAAAWDWTRQQFPEALFSVDAPVPMELQAGSSADLNRKWAGRDADSGMVYAMTAASNPAIASLPPMVAAETMVETFSKRWTITSRKTFDVPGGVGIEITAAMPTGGLNRMRVVVRGSWIYTVGVVVPTDRDDLLKSPDVDRFITSQQFMAAKP